MSNVFPFRPTPSSSSIEAEQALIGSLLFDNDCLSRCEGLEPEHFEERLYGDMFAGIVGLIKDGSDANPIALKSMFNDRPEFHDLGGLGHLLTLVEQAPPPRTAGDYGKIIVSQSRMRQIGDLGAEISRQSSNGSDPFDLADRAAKLLEQIAAESAPAGANLTDARSSAFTTLDEIDREASEGRAKGAMTGLRCFDRRLRGLRPGWLVVVAGRPSMGKTALARAAALGCAQRNRNSQVLFFALEMVRRELDERTLSQLSHLDGEGIAYQDLSGGAVTPHDRARLRSLAKQVPDNFIIDDTATLSVDYVRRRVMAMKRKGPIAAVFIDYLQIMQKPPAEGRNEASVIGEMTASLKRLAREADTCIVLLSQINRGVESRDDKRPQLSDLRDSGAIEQDANAVLFPYREVYYKERAKPKDANKQRDWEDDCASIYREMEVLAPKVRQGAAGTDKQIYWVEFDHIEDAAEKPRR